MGRQVRLRKEEPAAGSNGGAPAPAGTRPSLVVHGAPRCREIVVCPDISHLAHHIKHTLRGPHIRPAPWCAPITGPWPSTATRLVWAGGTAMAAPRAVPGRSRDRSGRHQPALLHHHDVGAGLFHLVPAICSRPPRPTGLGEAAAGTSRLSERLRRVRAVGRLIEHQHSGRHEQSAWGDRPGAALSLAVALDRRVRVEVPQDTSGEWFDDGCRDSASANRAARWRPSKRGCPAAVTDRPGSRAPSTRPRPAPGRTPGHYRSPTHRIRPRSGVRPITRASSSSCGPRSGRAARTPGRVFTRKVTPSTARSRPGTPSTGRSPPPGLGHAVGAAIGAAARTALPRARHQQTPITPHDHPAGREAALG